MGVEVLAGVVVAALGPFMPALTKAAQDAGARLTEAIANHGGEVAWDLAQKAWGKITARFQNDPEIASLSTLVATVPENKQQRYQEDLAELLAERLAAQPDLAKELTELFGGEQAVQRIAVGNRALIEAVHQRMAGRGRQEITAGDDARIIGTTQTMDNGS
jgi:nucleotide-binding universal stress UspA family protein